MLIPKLLQLRRQGKTPTIYGDGKQTQGYTHVSDVVEANLLAALAPLPAGQSAVMNIGPQEETSVNEIAGLIGGPVEYIVPKPRGDFEEFRKSADNSRAKALLGWEPRVSLAEGMRDVLSREEFNC